MLAVLDPELGGDHDLIAYWRQGSTNQLFIDEWAVDLGGIEEIHTAIDRWSQQFRHLARVLGRTVKEAHAHAAQA